MDDQEDVSRATARYLRSTLPFDSKKAVLFVTETTQRFTRVDDDTSGGQTREDPFSLTGDEAKEFYEEVLAMPEQRDKLSKVGVSTRVSGHSKLRLKDSSKSVTASKNHTKQTASSSPFQLFQYAQNNQLDFLQSALSDQHHDVNIQDNFHWTLLMVAAYAGHMTIVKYLIGRGARWKEYTERGMNAADLARKQGYLDITELIESHDSDPVGDSTTQRDPEVHYCSLSSNQSVRKRSRSEGDKCGRRKRPRTLYCDSCQTTVGQSEGRHTASIVHLYNNQWQPANLPSYMIPESNRGFQMMLRSGWNPDKGLGSHRQGKMFPVKTVLKQDRSGIGLEKGKARVTHFSAHDKDAVRSCRDKYKKEQPSKKKKDIVQEKQKEKQWERRIRTIMNIEDSHLLT